MLHFCHRNSAWTKNSAIHFWLSWDRTGFPWKIGQLLLLFTKNFRKTRRVQWKIWKRSGLLYASLHSSWIYFTHHTFERGVWKLKFTPWNMAGRIWIWCWSESVSAQKQIWVWSYLMLSWSKGYGLEDRRVSSRSKMQRYILFLNLSENVPVQMKHPPLEQSPLQNPSINPIYAVEYFTYVNCCCCPF